MSSYNNTKLLLYTTESENVIFAFSTISFVASALMFYLLITRRQARTSMRPRMLIILAGLNSITAVIQMIGGLPITVAESWDEFFIVVQAVGGWFQWTKWTWKAMLTLHIYTVVASAMPADSEEEFECEKRYLAFTGVFWVVFGILELLFSPADPKLAGPEQKIENAINLAVLLVQYVFILMVLIRAFCIDPKSAAAAKYRKLVFVYVIVYLVVVTQLVIADLYQVQGIFDENNAFQLYLYYFGSPCFLLGGFTDAVVWGVSRSCMFRLIDKCCSSGSGVLLQDQPDQTKIELLLVKHRHDAQQHAATHRTDTTNPSRDYSAISNSSSCEEGEGATNRLKHSIPLQHLQLFEKVGSGGFGNVFKANYQGNVVAVKEVQCQLDSVESSAGSSVGWSGKKKVVTVSKQAHQTLSEAVILSGLRHPNTVHFYGVAVKEFDVSNLSPLVQKFASKVEAYLFVTEMCNGSLNNCNLGVGQVDGSELWAMLVHVAAGMQYLHSKGIVHRDLKPANVLVSEVVHRTPGSQSMASSFESTTSVSTESAPAPAPAQRTYKVCDFGLSRVLSEESRASAFDAGRSRGAGSTREMTGRIGTALYMAPEVIANDKRTMSAYPQASDLYSYAILAWQVLADELPFVGKELTMAQLKAQVVQGARPEIPRQGAYQSDDDGTPAWPVGIGELLQRCWAAQAGDRPSFSEVRQTLHDLKAGFVGI